MKIVWLSHSADIGGAELCLKEGAKVLTDRGHAVHAVVPCDGKLREVLASVTTSVRVAPVFWWASSAARSGLAQRTWRWAKNVEATWKLTSDLRDISPDVVVTNTLTTPAGAYAARRLHLPHVWFAHELMGERGHSLNFDWGAARSLSVVNRLSAVVAGPSETVLAQFAGHVAKDKLRLIRYSADTPKLARPKPHTSALKIVVVGRVHPPKRQEDAVRALAILRERNVDAKLSVVGSEDPAYAARLRELVLSLGLSSRVEFIGFTDNPFSRVASSDVAVVCSSGEACPRVIVEAMKLRTFVVAADSGGSAELVRDGWNGLLFPAGDAEALARILESVHRDKANSSTMVENAERWATEVFSADSYANSLLAALQRARDSQ